MHELIQRELWNHTNAEGAAHEETLLDQYRLYVEMADRVSHRRGTANSYFLLVNSVATVAVTTLGADRDESSLWPLFFATVVLVGICAAWFYIVRSYRQLSSAKWAVVGALETRMPASPWNTEWQALGAGEDRSNYWPLTHIENWVPVLFALIYVGAFVILAYVA